MRVLLPLEDMHLLQLGNDEPDDILRVERPSSCRNWRLTFPPARATEYLQFSKALLLESKRLLARRAAADEKRALATL